MLVVEIAVVLVFMAGVFVIVSRDAGPTRSVAHVLHDVENPRRNGGR